MWRVYEIKQYKTTALFYMRALSVTGFIILSLILPKSADAYVDPNTGGFIFTSVLPFVYGLLAAVVVFWKRIAFTVKNIFSKKKGKGDS